MDQIDLLGFSSIQIYLSKIAHIREEYLMQYDCKLWL